MPASDHGSVQLTTPSLWGEIKRFGRKKIFLHWSVFVSIVLSVVFSVVVPFGQSGKLGTLVGMHSVLAGFAFAIFGFVIIGGKDDFLTLRMREGGLAVLEGVLNMILHLFWPFCIQLVVLLLVVSRMLIDEVWLPVVYAWRVLYGALAIYGFIQIYFAIHFIYVIAVGRYVFLYQKAKQGKLDSSPHTASVSRKGLKESFRFRQGRKKGHH